MSLWLGNGDDSLDYIKVLYDFASVFYKVTTILKRAKSEALSTILTSSTEYFILLLTIVHFEDNVATEYAKCYAEINLYYAQVGRK